MTDATKHIEPAPTGLAAYWWPIGAAAVLLAAFAWLFKDFMHTQASFAIQKQADWGHIAVIPFISAGFAWMNRDRLRAAGLRTCWAGLLPIVFGIGWYAMCSLVDVFRHHNLQAFGAWTTLVGLVLLFCGPKALKILAFPLLYLLFFGQAVSDRAIKFATLPLQDLAAAGSHIVLTLLSFDSELNGNNIKIFDKNMVAYPLNVAEACSGMRMVFAFLALGVALAYSGLKLWRQRTLLVLMALPTALFVNILRVVTLALLSLVHSDLAAGDFHSFIGLLWLVPALLIYLGLMWVIRNLVTEAETPAATEPVGEAVR